MFKGNPSTRTPTSGVSSLRVSQFLFLGNKTSREKGIGKHSESRPDIPVFAKCWV